MARLIQMAGRAFRFSSSPKTLISLLQRSHLQIEQPLCISRIQARNYISEMRKSAFEGNILRILCTEIQYESEYAPPKQPVMEFNSFTVEDRPGEQWIRLRGKYGDKEDIKIEATMFDGSVSAPKPTEDGQGEDTRLHISLIVDVSKEEGCDVLEFVCSAWPDSLEIQRVFMLRRDGMPTRPYVGPDFKDLDDELQNAYQEFLEERGVNDELAVFLHEYMVNKAKTEFIRWLENVKSFIEKH
ncbi:hypothetical protein NE237_025484 [Protea cynaroides]|uniref:Mitochondrial glycoprotein n=1 Tax=Protea cynaroides TaxID=273540 RepID=A0A9Q0H4Z8_9MAGN|nr:hypothetical protein NE237_025484 [Protea cynaroides]